MKCAKCSMTISQTARFCPTCGEPAVEDTDFKGDWEVTLEWVKAVLEADGYSGLVKQDGWLDLTHEQKPNLSITRSPGFLGVESNWIIKPPRWGRKRNFERAVAKADTLTWLCRVSSAPDAASANQIVCVRTYLYLTERISSRDIRSFANYCSMEVIRVLDISGVRTFA